MLGADLTHNFGEFCPGFCRAIEKSCEDWLQAFPAGGIQHLSLCHNIEIADE